MIKEKGSTEEDSTGVKVKSETEKALCSAMEQAY